MTHSQKLAAEFAMIGGTVAGFLASYSSDLIKTIICAALGATTSFIVTLFLKWVVKKISKK